MAEEMQWCKKSTQIVQLGSFSRRLPPATMADGGAGGGSEKDVLSDVAIKEFFTSLDLMHTASSQNMLVGGEAPEHVLPKIHLRVCFSGLSLTHYVFIDTLQRKQLMLARFAELQA